MTGLLGTRRAVATAAVGATLVAQPVGSDPLITHSYNQFGMPGLLEMPTAESANDGELAGTYGRIFTQQRSTLSFQIERRVTGSFRYSVLPDFGENFDLFDRSFDLQFQLTEDEQWWPAVALGLRDFIGTGVYSSE
ncbi:MAG: YjbH domain-containing protein, partial [Pseudomonadota bacterium]